MKENLNRFLMTFLLATTVFGCAYNVIEEPNVVVDPCDQFVGAPCDSVTVKYTYTGQISKLMTDEGCNGCHDGNTPGAPEIDTKEKLIAYVKDCDTRKLLEDAIDHTSSNVAKRMPQGDAKLSAAKINMLKNWICQGAKP